MSRAAKVRLAGALLLLGLLLAAYGPSLRGGFLWDDDVYVAGNELLTAPDGLRRIWFSTDAPSQYFPLTYTLMRAERSALGLDPLGYHLVSVGLHGANALLAALVLGLLAAPGAWLAAALFALHPVQVESVAWITEQKNLLSTLFYLAALWAWIRSLEVDGRRRRWFGAGVFAFYLLALFAKTTACTLPAALVLAAWRKGIRLTPARRLQVAALLGIGLAMGLFTAWWEQHLQGSRDAGVRFPFLDCVLIASRALWFYAGKLLWPVRLEFSYSRWAIDASDPRQYGWLLAGLAAAVGLALLWRRGIRGPALAALFFVACLSPLLGFIPLYTFQYSFVADHYQYLACLGPIALATAGAAGLARRVGLPAWSRRALAALPILLLAALTRQQAHAYRDIETLWRDTIAKNPASWMARDNLGCELAAQDRFGEAVESFRAALQIHPRSARTHFNLANTLGKMGRGPEALAAYDRALAEDPLHAKSRFNKAHLLASLGRAEEAAAGYEEALRVAPGMAVAHVNLALLLAGQGRVGEAEEHYREALRLEPDNPDACNAYGMLLAARGDLAAAQELYGQAIRLRPDHAHAHNNLANALAREGRWAEAVPHYEAALQADPGLAEAHFNFAAALRELGRPDEARVHIEEAVRLRPDLAGRAP
ncbi:MAG TPA: tetratricopeptide repeat protein [Kiritimatiellia bacterium]|nr:tetratricopeptide repeat protein [Kiritimatiellia bacterium]HRZ13140.1 tetratricopeptide repeat protein [Kiritimatiellia bacterium]HSA17561.1 tetratricopeptide repeat protein [Kiritimatiellia bacterium]